MFLTYRDIAGLDALLKDAGQDEIVVETATQRCVLSRVPGGWVQETTMPAEPTLLSRGTETSDDGSRVDKQARRPSAQDGCVDIIAKLPGIFYRAPKPGAVPFVDVGSRVADDTVVGIIETMKLMNSVASGASGEISEICVANGTQVEAQDVLMRVLPERTP